MSMLLEKQRSERSKVTAIIDRAEKEKRELTAEEEVEFRTHTDNLASIAERMEAEVQFRADADAANAALREMDGSGRRRSEDRAGQWIYEATGKRAAVRAGESFRSHEAVSGHSSPQEDATVGMHGNLGNLVRALTLTGGAAVVPTIWASELIDLARNKSAVMQAGASLIPMTAGTVKIGRLTGDPTAAFRAEASTITPSDPTFDNVTLTANTMSTLVIGSLEWFQDANNADQIVKDAIAKAIALRLDLVGLYGGIVAGAGTTNLPTPPNPRGVLAALNAVLPANVLGAAANGTAQTAGTYFNEVLDTIYAVKNRNEEPTGIIWPTKLERQYAGANDTTGQPLRLPGAVEGIPRYASNQIPSYTQGTMTSRATDLFVGDWSQLLIGQRLGITIQVLTEKYADTGQIGIVAHWRGDVQPARPSAFAVYKAIQGAL